MLSYSLVLEQKNNLMLLLIYSNLVTLIAILNEYQITFIYIFDKIIIPILFS